MQAGCTEGVRDADSDPLTGLSLSADIETGVDLLGKDVTDLQGEVSIDVNNRITGTLAYIDDYTGFSGDPAEQVGHYIAVKATAGTGAVITAQVIGGDHGPVTLDEDGILIARIKNTRQKLKFTATVGNVTDELVYTLDGLTLAEEA